MNVLSVQMLCYYLPGVVDDGGVVVTAVVVSVVVFVVGSVVE